MEGTWEQADTWEGMAEGMVVIGEMTEAIPEDVRASATALMESIAVGRVPPVHRPDQPAGRHRVAGRRRNRR
jgi:basic membrane protein A